MAYSMRSRPRRSPYVETEAGEKSKAEENILRCNRLRSSRPKINLKKVENFPQRKDVT
jgi:hypothetical protein